MAAHAFASFSPHPSRQFCFLKPTLPSNACHIQAGRRSKNELMPSNESHSTRMQQVKQTQGSKQLPQAEQPTRKLAGAPAMGASATCQAPKAGVEPTTAPYRDRSGDKGQRLADMVSRWGAACRRDPSCVCKHEQRCVDALLGRPFRRSNVGAARQEVHIPPSSGGVCSPP